MLKTTNLGFWRKKSSFWFFFPLLFCAQTTAAQQGGTAQRPAPATPNTSVEINSRAKETVIDASIPGDPAIEKLLAPYRAKVRELDVVIGTLESELKRAGIGSSLGNFVADGMRAQANKKLGEPVTVAITNSGGLRRNAIPPGEIHVRDIFELLPFENSLVVLDLSGERLLNALRIVVSNREVQSGAVLRYRTGADKKPELVSAMLIGADGKRRKIDPAATYRVVTTDYLLSVSGGRFSMLQAAPNQKPMGLTIRDALIEYVRSETAAGRPIKAKLDGRFVFQAPTAPNEEEPR